MGAKTKEVSLEDLTRRTIDDHIKSYGDSELFSRPDASNPLPKMRYDLFLEGQSFLSVRVKKREIKLHFHYQYLSPSLRELTNKLKEMGYKITS